MENLLPLLEWINTHGKAADHMQEIIKNRKYYTEERIQSSTVEMQENKERMEKEISRKKEEYYKSLIENERNIRESEMNREKIKEIKEKLKFIRKQGMPQEYSEILKLSELNLFDFARLAEGFGIIKE